MKNPEYFRNGPEFIASMEELIKRYEKSIELGISKHEYEKQNYLKCLLCNPLNIEKNQFHYYQNEDITFIQACSKLGCPWVVITGKTCDDTEKEVIYCTKKKNRMKTRIKQLKLWIEIYKKHMEEK